MALSNIQLYKIQALLSEQLKNYENIAQKFKSCLDLHLHGNNMKNTDDKAIMDIIDILQHEAENVARLELRMAIVAPMKAGKSTIINALIGDNILPTRGSAMTTLPTEIAFHKETACPTLILTKEGIDLIMKLQHRIQLYLKSTKSSVEEIFHNQTQLVKIAVDIFGSKTGCYFIPLANTTGLNQIQQTLTFINDLVRIYLILSKKEDSDLKDVSLKPLLQKSIRLEVPAGSLRYENINDTETSVGNLTIVDTPGPNEASASQELQEIVRGELQKAAIVILVLNFTTMGTETDQEIFEEVDAIREANVDNDCIYVIVNKVDQRRKGDMSKDDVKKFIATRYQIEEKTNQPSDKRIFEMKAVHCLVLRRFFREIKEFENSNQSIEIKKLTTVEELTNELYKFEVDEDERDLEQLRKDAKNMWKHAGFEEFTECAISDLIKKIAPRSIISALNICFRNGNKLHEQITLRQTLLDASVKSLENESEQLQLDCDKLTKLRNENLIKLDEECTKLGKQIDGEMKIALDRCEALTAELFRKDTWQSNFDLGRYYAKRTFGTGLILGGILTGVVVTGGVLGIVGAAVAGVAGSTVLQNTDDTKSFANEDEAKKFIDALREEVNGLCYQVYKSLRDKIDSICSNINNSLLKYLVATTSDIVNKANERLNKNFKIELTSLEKIEIQIAKIDINVDASIQKYRPLWGYLLIGRKSRISPEEESQVSDIKLCMSRTEIKKICTGFIENNMKMLQEEINKNYKEELRKTFHSHFDNLHALFQEYKDRMTETLSAKKISKDKQKQFSTDLEMILTDVKTEAVNVKKLANELNIKIKDV
jgi:GTPase SAR1 family protein